MTILWIIVLILVLLAALWCLALAPRINTPRRMEELRQYAYAHRGLHDIAAGVPENSMAAFQRAVESGFGAELDVHLSADGLLYVMHDSSLKRTCGVDACIEDLTEDQLVRCRLEGTRERIPRLEQVLSLFEGRAPLIIELKAERGNADALTDAVLRTLTGYRGLFCIESFDPRVLRRLKKRRPGVVRGQLSGSLNRHGAKLKPYENFVLKNLLTNFLTRPDFVAYRFSDRRAPSLQLCRLVWGVQEFSWTITSNVQLRAVEKAGAVPIFEGFDPR